MKLRRISLAAAAFGFLAITVGMSLTLTPIARAGTPPIQHVVIIYQENHSFDNTLGGVCNQINSGQVIGHMTCDGASSGLGSIGKGTKATNVAIPLATAPDLVHNVGHDVGTQIKDINGGNMNGFNSASGCGSGSGYACYVQYAPSGIPNLAALAEKYVISDRTFEFATTPSWAGHMVLASATNDGFVGDNPSSNTGSVGWGCDSGYTSAWDSGTQILQVPSCIPNAQGQGPFTSSPVPYVPTIFDRLDQASLSWKIYGGSGGKGSGYGWTICPTFYECLGSSQRQNLVPANNVLSAATNGTLPNFSIVTPTLANSQHNNQSMLTGDNWIGSIVSSIENGPDWASTAIFITYDDCGCFYDHVPPPSSATGIRVPMVIVSPYAKPGYTDSNNATFISMLAYTEHLFGLAPLNSSDASSYDYSNSFDYTQTPTMQVQHMSSTQIPAAEQQYILDNPTSGDDPT